MGDPVGLVQNRIQIDGVDNASDAIRKAQDSLRGLEAQSAKTGGAAGGLRSNFKGVSDEAGGLGERFNEAGEAGAGAMSKIGRLARPLAGFTGNAAGEVKELGHGLHGMALAMELLPGPVGLAVGAIAGLTVGAVLLNKHIAESAAKMELLGGPSADALKKGLNLDADSAVKLSQALDGLANKNLVPSTELLKKVGENAERMGKEPAEAMVKFVAAIAAGPDELGKFQKEFGKLAGLSTSGLDLAKQIGLSPEALGLSKELTAEEARKKDISEALTAIEVKNASVRLATAASMKAADEAANTVNFVKRATLQRESEEQTHIADSLRSQIASERELLGDMQRVAELAAATAAAQGNLHSRVALLDAEAAAASSKKAKYSLQEQAATAAKLEATRALNAFDAEHGKTTDDNLQKQRNELQVTLLTAQARDEAIKTEKDADAKADKAKGKAGAAARLQALEAEASAVGRLAKAEADAAQDYATRTALQLKLIDAEEKAAVASAAKIHTTRLGHQASEQAAHVEATAKRLALETEAAQKLAQLHQQTLDAQDNADKAKAQTIAQRLQAQGRQEEAIDTELAQTRADAAAAIIKAESEVAKARADRKISAAELAEIEAQAAAKSVVAAESVAQAERKAADAKRALRAEDIDKAASALEGVGAALSNIGQNGNYAAQAIGGSISSMSKGLSALGHIADDDAQKLGKTVEAIGVAAAGVANTIIAASSQRLLAQLDVEEQGALKGAKTEEEKARITEKFEKKKADARDSAQRQSAGVMAAVSAAMAIAYAFTPGMQAAAVGQGVAAAAFLAIAGGAAGSSYVPGAHGGAGGAGGFNQPAGGAGGGSSGGGTGTTTVVNFNQPFVTGQQIGVALSAYQKSLAVTGFATSRPGF